MSHHDVEEVVHEYDGIQELDNFLPRWWVLLFYAAIVFGVIYMAYYHVSGIGLSPTEKYDVVVESRAADAAARLAAMPVDTNIVVRTQAATDAPTLAQGQAVFSRLCVVCHTESGAGLVGPNLTDAYWLNGPSFVDSVRVITDGVPEKGMISWQSQLDPDEIEDVASYLYSLRGTNPANPKDPEGTEVPGSDSPDYARADEH